MSDLDQYMQQADEMLSKRINEIQSFFGISRIGWHILNSINKQGRMLKHDLLALLRPLAEDKALHDLLIKYRIEGIIYEVEEKLILTTNGMQLFSSCNDQYFGKEMG